MSNLSLWNSVSKTNPAHTKEVSKGRRKFTAICPQSQIESATEQFGPYGLGWGLKDITRDFDTLRCHDLAIFSGVFWFKRNDEKGEFEISTSLSLFIDKNKTMLDTDICKKAETDLVTKALSKIGFNADVFKGKFDDNRYVQEMQAEFNKPATISDDQLHQINQLISNRGLVLSDVLNAWKLSNLSELHLSNLQNMMNWINSQEDNPAQEEAPVNKSQPRNAKQQYFKDVAQDVKQAAIKKQQQQMIGAHDYYEQKRNGRYNQNKQPVNQKTIEAPKRFEPPKQAVITPQQVKQLQSGLQMAGMSSDQFCQLAGDIRVIGELSQDRFESAMARVKQEAMRVAH